MVIEFILEIISTFYETLRSVEDTASFGEIILKRSEKIIAVKSDRFAYNERRVRGSVSWDAPEETTTIIALLLFTRRRLRARTCGLTNIKLECEVLLNSTWT